MLECGSLVPLSLSIPARNTDKVTGEGKRKRHQAAFGQAVDDILDLALLAGYTRNQSNDEYNDYSALSLSLSVGLSF